MDQSYNDLTLLQESNAGPILRPREVKSMLIEPYQPSSTFQPMSQTI